MIANEDFQATVSRKTTLVSQSLVLNERGLEDVNGFNKRCKHDVWSMTAGDTWFIRIKSQQGVQYSCHCRTCQWNQPVHYFWGHAEHESRVHIRIHSPSVFTHWSVRASRLRNLEMAVHSTTSMLPTCFIDIAFPTFVGGNNQIWRVCAKLGLDHDHAFRIRQVTNPGTGVLGGQAETLLPRKC